MDAQLIQRLKKSAIGASSVTLVPTTSGPSEALPNHLKGSQLVWSTGGVTPPAEFWGTAVTDGIEYEVSIRRVT